MIVVDSSAVVAVLLGEPEKPIFQTVLAGDEPCVMSAVNVHETATVLRLRHGTAAVDRLWQFLADIEIATVPFDAAQVRVAAQAFDRYGKGIHPRARLNLSDCAAYALAKTLDAPLLFKGSDFVHTDVASCL